MIVARSTLKNEARLSARGGNLAEGQRMLCKIWSGPMLGIRIATPNRNRYFSRQNKSIFIEIEGKLCRTELPDTFWTTCPEIRVALDEHGRNYLSYWITKNNLLPPTRSKELKGKEDIVVLEVAEPRKRFKLYLP